VVQVAARASTRAAGVTAGSVPQEPTSPSVVIMVGAAAACHAAVCSLA